MQSKIRNVLIVADIEGSSGCWDYRASSFMTPQWARAWVAMSLDVRAVVDALFNAGVEQITIKDFHRTGYNLLPEMINAKSEIIHGYRREPVPGFGDPGPAQAVIFMGMHAASGTIDPDLLPDAAGGEDAAILPYGLQPVGPYRAILGPPPNKIRSRNLRLIK